MCSVKYESFVLFPNTFFDILQILCGSYSSYTYSNVHVLSTGHENCYIQPFEKIWLCGEGVVVYISFYRSVKFQGYSKICFRYLAINLILKSKAEINAFLHCFGIVFCLLLFNCLVSCV
jgi:hypothetical protein